MAFLLQNNSFIAIIILVFTLKVKFMTIKILLLEPDSDIRESVKNALLKLEEEVIIVEQGDNADIVITNRSNKDNKLLSTSKDIYQECIQSIGRKHMELVEKMSCPSVFDMNQHVPDFVKQRKKNNKLNSRSKNLLRR